MVNPRAARLLARSAAAVVVAAAVTVTGDGGAPACDATDFHGHHCPLTHMTNLTAPTITTGPQCWAACCAARPHVNCTTAQFDTSTSNCWGGDWHTSSSCRRTTGWQTYLINFSPSPPPSPTPPTPPPAPAPAPPAPAPAPPAPPPPPGSTVLNLQGPSDFFGAPEGYSSEASITTGAPFGEAIRSGAPRRSTSVSLDVLLSPGVTVEDIAFSYRQVTGYTQTGTGPNFTLAIAGSAAFSSGPLTGHPYPPKGKGCPGGACYSPPTMASASSLGITVPSKGTQRITFEFHNTDMNLQLLLPMNLTLTCARGVPCVKGPKLLPHFFDSNMVLQRSPVKAAVWGHTAAPGDEVTVSLSSDPDAADVVGGPWKAKAAANGSWAVAMDPQTAGSGMTLTVSTKSGRTQVLKNIAFGDVVLCSGQSNMGFSANLEFNASAEIADSVNYPGLRFWTSAQVAGNTPQTDLKNIQMASTDPALVGVYASSAWAISKPAAFVPPPAMGEKATFTWPSAVCYFYGRNIYKALGGKVPIGLVAADWGGEPIEPFMSADALSDKSCGGTKPAATTEVPSSATPQEEIATTTKSGTSSTIWNGMIAPLAKMRFSAIIWYQGESNYRQPGPYACSFPAMIHDWRAKFALPKLPFYFVQLAPCYGHKDCGNFVNIRNAQMAGLLLPNVSYATAADLGDRTSPYVSVHPRRKQELCRRLSLQALKLQYGMTTLVSSGPEFASVAVAGSTLTVKYKPGTAGTLHAAETADSPDGCTESPFEVSTAAGKWAQANFTIVGETVTLKMPDGVTALTSTGVRYAWVTAPTCMLYNGKGAPGTGPNGTQPIATPGATGIAGTPFCWTGTDPCPV